jgi:hypothetical protein
MMQRVLHRTQRGLGVVGGMQIVDASHKQSRG